MRLSDSDDDLLQSVLGIGGADGVRARPARGEVVQYAALLLRIGPMCRGELPNSRSSATPFKSSRKNFPTKLRSGARSYQR